MRRGGDAAGFAARESAEEAARPASGAEVPGGPESTWSFVAEESLRPTRYDAGAAA